MDRAPDAKVGIHCLELTLYVCLATMADRWAHSTDGYSFRFFSPEQIDQILREGATRGRVDSHAATSWGCNPVSL